MIYASWGACKNYHSDLFQRAMALLMAITGNQGRKGRRSGQRETRCSEGPDPCCA
jgi:anaerobic selenocysteine-containing dehydrogenase